MGVLLHMDVKNQAKVLILIKGSTIFGNKNIY